MAREQHPHTLGQQRGSLGSRVTSGSPWSAGCDESRTSGAEGGPGKRTGSNPDTAPRPDPYITGAENKSAIGTLVERATGYVALLHLPGAHGAVEVQQAMVEVMSNMPASLRRTLTWDQGREMSNHVQIAAATDLDIYFCDPHSPWQRGTNENTNGLLRQYFPKGTDLSGYHHDYLDFVARELNTRPRKRLAWRTPAEALDRLLSQSTNPPGVALTG